MKTDHFFFFSRVAILGLLLSFWGTAGKAQVINTIAGTGIASYSGDGSAAVAATINAPEDVVVAANGDVYIADYSNNRVRKIDAAGNISTVVGSVFGGFAGDGGLASAARINGPSGLAIDTGGNIYIADRGNQRIRKINTSGIISTVAGTGASGYTGDGGPATAATFAFMSRIAVDKYGNIFVGDLNNYCVRKISATGIITTVAGTGTYGFSGDGGPGNLAQLSNPMGVAVDTSGNLYIADNTNACVRIVTPAGIINTFAGRGAGTIGGAATNTSISFVSDVACDAKGNVYVTGQYTNRIFKIGPTRIINFIAGTGSFGGFSGDGGPAVDAEFDMPTGITTDTAGTIYVVDYKNQRIRKFASTCAPQVGIIALNQLNARVGTTVPMTAYTAGGTWSSSNTAIATIDVSGNVTGVAIGGVIISYSLTNSCGTTVMTHALSVVTNAPPCDVITTVAGMGSGSGTSTGDGGPATAATFGSLWGIAFDAAGNLYSADNINSVVRKITPAGMIDVFAGTTATSGYSGDGGPATAALIARPSGIATDAAGNVYICDEGSNTIRKVNTSGIITTIAGTGVAGFSGDNGQATAARINYPRGIATDGAGNVYFIDGANFRVRRINSAGVIKTIAGRGTVGYTGDGGPATAAKLGALWGLCTDVAGNIYCTDLSYRIVRKINAAGTITTVGGMGRYYYGFTGDGGPATAALMYIPRCITADRFQNLYVGDYIHIRKIDTHDTINSIAGNGEYDLPVDGLPALEASVNGMYGMAMDTGGNLHFINNSNCIKKITKDGVPYVAHIEGDHEFCAGNTITLTDSTPRGVWTSSDTTIATISNTGEVYGLAGGTVVITYSLHYSCGDFRVFDTLTVHGQVGAITGNMNVCEAGGTTLLADTTVGGIWSTSDSAYAYVDTGGWVTGVVQGTVIITYATGANCFDTALITVSSPPSPILGVPVTCEGSSTLLTDTTAGGTWATSNPAIASVDATGLVTGVAAGMDTIYYVLSGGCSAFVPFTVHPIPPAITGSTSFCAGGSTTLFNALSGGSWTSSDTTIARANATTGVITGVSGGSATISYTLSGCANTIFVTVYPYPTSTITPIGDTTMCTGGFVVLAAASATGYTYQWYTGATAISGGTDDYTVAYATAGASSATYQVLITSSFGCSMLSAPINISTNPAVASITYSGATTFCTGSSLTLNANTGTGLTYQWMLSGAAISGATTTSLIAGSSGAYHVVVTNATGCIASAAPVTLTALPVPDNTLNVTGSLTFCAGDSVHLGAVSASGVTYQWQDGGIDITGATGSSYTATATGNYRVVLTNSYPCSSASAIATVTTLPLPATAITVSGSTTFCTGSTVGLSVTAVAGNTYQWYRNSAAIPGAISATYPASLSGNYTVRVISAAGCTQITPTPVVLSELTDPVVRPLTPLSHCWGGNTVLAIVGSTSGLTFQWYRNGTAVAGGTNATFNARPTGYYAVSVYHPSGGCTVNSAWVSVTEYPLPNPVVSWTGTQLRTGNFYATYQWFRNMTIVPGATTHTIVPFGTATYEVLVTDSNGCQSMSTGFPFPVLDGTITDTAGSGGSGGSGTGGTTGIAVTTGADILIFPNPTSNVIYISAPIALRAELHAMDGRKILEQQNVHEINLTDIAGGMYTLMLFNREGTMLRVEKVVKE